MDRGVFCESVLQCTDGRKNGTAPVKWVIIIPLNVASDAHNGKVNKRIN
jgi:hypothetical protein